MKIIKFEKPNCAPCNSVSTFLGTKKVAYERVNPFDDPDLGVQFRIMSVPVVVLLNDDGSEIKRSIGFKPDELEEIINQLN